MRLFQISTIPDNDRQLPCFKVIEMQEERGMPCFAAIEYCVAERLQWRRGDSSLTSHRPSDNSRGLVTVCFGLIHAGSCHAVRQGGISPPSEIMVLQQTGLPAVCSADRPLPVASFSAWHVVSGRSSRSHLLHMQDVRKIAAGEAGWCCGGCF